MTSQGRHRLVVKTERTFPASRTRRIRAIGETIHIKTVESRFLFSTVKS